MSATVLQRFLREPLLHFTVLGGLFFLVYAAVNGPGRDADDVIVITPERVAQIATEFNSVWKRTPSEDELENLIREEIRSEVYYRDALALGLDKNDAIVRRRLRQKMEFLTDTGSWLKEPSAGELERYYVANEQVYRSEPRLAFEQVYLGGNPSSEDVFNALDALKPGSVMDPSSLGQPTFLPAQLKLSQPDAIDSVFGNGFYSRIAALTPGVWAGPVSSTYGVHLVRTLGSSPVRTPPLEEVRDAVLKDWKSAKAMENREQDYAQRRNRYSIKIQRDETADEGTR